MGNMHKIGCDIIRYLLNVCYAKGELQVQFEVPPGDSAIEAKVEAAKAALRDLGLQEDVQMR